MMNDFWSNREMIACILFCSFEHNIEHEHEREHNILCFKSSPAFICIAWKCSQRNKTPGIETQNTQF